MVILRRSFPGLSPISSKPTSLIRAFLRALETPHPCTPALTPTPQVLEMVVPPGEGQPLARDLGTQRIRGACRWQTSGILS